MILEGRDFRYALFVINITPWKDSDLRPDYCWFRIIPQYIQVHPDSWWFPSSVCQTLMIHWFLFYILCMIPGDSHHLCAKPLWYIDSSSIYYVWFLMIPIICVPNSYDTLIHLLYIMYDSWWFLNLYPIPILYIMVDSWWFP